MSRGKNRSPLLYILALLLAVVCGAGIFLSGYRYDNRYRYPAHPSGSGRMGILRLDMEAYEQNPLLFLVDDWEFYPDKQLTPEALAQGLEVPDEYVFIGRYGGAVWTGGEAPGGTLRLTVYADDAARSYALELPELSPASAVWINGESRAAVAGSFIAFTASERIEIVIAAPDGPGVAVCPPALGSPEAVSRLLSTRHLICGVGLGVVLVVLALCLGFGIFWRRRSGTMLLLALLCALFVCWTGPAFGLLPFNGEWGAALGQASALAMLPVAFWLQGWLCAIPKRVYIPAVCLGALFPVAAVLCRRLWVRAAADMHWYALARAVALGVAGVYLLAVAILALVRGRRCARPLLWGFCVVLVIMLMALVFPWYKPIVLGSPVEMAGFALLCVFAGVLFRETAWVYRERGLLTEKEGLFRQRMELLRDQARMRREFEDSAGTVRARVKERLQAMQEQLQNGRLYQVSVYLGTWIQEEDPKPDRCTENELINDIVSGAASKAHSLGIRFDTSLAGIPPKIAMEDRHLCTLLMSILDNALEACAAVSDAALRWISLEIKYAQGNLVVRCANAHSGAVRKKQGLYLSTKGDGRTQGWGLPMVGQIAAKYAGTLRASHDDSSFRVYVGVKVKAAE